MLANKIATNYADFFAKINVNTSLESYREIFDPKVIFEDPFQKVEGIETLYAIFQDMYQTLYQPSFKIIEVLSQDTVAYIRWELHYQRKEAGKNEMIDGVSRVLFGEDNKVLEHKDFWDAADSVYAKIPILGWFIKALRKRIAHA